MYKLSEEDWSYYWMAISWPIYVATIDILPSTIIAVWIIVVRIPVRIPIIQIGRLTVKNWWCSILRLHFWGYIHYSSHSYCIFTIRINGDFFPIWASSNSYALMWNGKGSRSHKVWEDIIYSMSEIALDDILQWFNSWWCWANLASKYRVRFWPYSNAVMSQRYVPHSAPIPLMYTFD